MSQISALDHYGQRTSWFIIGESSRHKNLDDDVRHYSSQYNAHRQDRIRVCILR